MCVYIYIIERSIWPPVVNWQPRGCIAWESTYARFACFELPEQYMNENRLMFAPVSVLQTDDWCLSRRCWVKYAEVVQHPPTALIKLFNLAFRHAIAVVWGVRAFRFFCCRSLNISHERDAGCRVLRSQKEHCSHGTEGCCHPQLLQNAIEWDPKHFVMVDWTGFLPSSCCLKPKEAMWTNRVTSPTCGWELTAGFTYRQFVVNGLPEEKKSKRWKVLVDPFASNYNSN